MTDVQIAPEQVDYELIVGKMVVAEQPSLVGDELAEEVAKTIEESRGALKAFVNGIWQARRDAVDPPQQMTDETIAEVMRAAAIELDTDEVLTAADLDQAVTDVLTDPIARVFVQAAWERAGEKLSQA
ncbi:hypothetical protein [Micromonospora chalcea]|uniref:hypothetical protein n=1 Tax=Micromonospora chalcea TaxID=1874 RepID=UPI003D736BE6